MNLSLTFFMTAFAGLLNRIERLQDRIARLQLRPQNDRRVARIARLEDKVEQAESLLPKDTFEITYKAPTAERSFYRFEVAITDSPFDDTFTGGDDLLLRVRATKPFHGRTVTSTLANGDYWAGNDEQTLTLGGSSYDFTDYETVTATLAIDTRDWATVNSNMGDVLAVQTFDMTTLFA